jgi:hypothetical protein
MEHRIGKIKQLKVGFGLLNHESKRGTTETRFALYKIGKLLKNSEKNKKSESFLIPPIVCRLIFGIVYNIEFATGFVFAVRFLVNGCRDNSMLTL